jgi:hypothetical protein
LQDAIGFANVAIMTATRYLKPNPEDRQKQTTLLVISVTPDQISLLTDSIQFFSRLRKCKKMFSSSAVIQCHHCSRFGHLMKLCKQELPTCLICAGAHFKEAHHCGNPGCIKGGNDKPVPACCNTTPLKCPNCGDKYTAFFPDSLEKIVEITIFQAYTNHTSSIPVASHEENEDMDDHMDKI